MLRFERPRRQAPLIAVLLIVAAGLGFGGLGYATSGSETTAFQEAGQEPAAEIEFVSGRVESISAGELTLATDTGRVVLRLSSDAAIESFGSATLDSLRPGDWLNASAIPHEQTVFVLVGLVVIPAESLAETP